MVENKCVLKLDNVIIIEVKVALDNKMSGVIDDVCLFLFKSPRNGSTESEAFQ